MKPQALIATNTLGMGARPGEIEGCKSDPKAWVLTQIENPDPLIDQLRNAPSASELVNRRRQKRAVLEKRLEKKQHKGALFDRKSVLMSAAANHHQELAWRHKQAVSSQTSFVERWAWFWSNRFTVSARDQHLRLVAGAFERDAIRPNIFLRFEDMLVASSLHPAMIYYLDNVKSVGPNSAIARKFDGKHNENLGREILELHTMGVGGGYTIHDITALSFGLTGWTFAKEKQGYKTVFMRNRHEPAQAKLLGKIYDKHGPEKIHDMLRDIARHPSTARNIAENLTAHFIAGAPSSSAISKLQTCFLDTEGDLKALAKCLINLDEVWSQPGWIMKRPDEFVVSIERVLPAWRDQFNPRINKLLGQPLMQASGPDGWAQTGEDWINAENIMIRLGWLRQALKKMPNWVNIEFFIEEALGGYVSTQTSDLLSNPLPRNELLALGLMSPEFMRR